jgi:hypothetical protein
MTLIFTKNPKFEGFGKPAISKKGKIGKIKKINDEVFPNEIPP